MLAFLPAINIRGLSGLPTMSACGTLAIFGHLTTAYSIHELHGVTMHNASDAQRKFRLKFQRTSILVDLVTRLSRCRPNCTGLRYPESDDLAYKLAPLLLALMLMAVVEQVAAQVGRMSAEYSSPFESPEKATQCVLLTATKRVRDACRLAYFSLPLAPVPLQAIPAQLSRLMFVSADITGFRNRSCLL